MTTTQTKQMHKWLEGKKEFLSLALFDIDFMLNLFRLTNIY